MARLVKWSGRRSSNSDFGVWVLPKWAEELPREGGGWMAGGGSDERRVNRDPIMNWC